jgi:hypothetical protein
MHAVCCVMAHKAQSHKDNAYYKHNASVRHEGRQAAGQLLGKYIAELLDI